MSGRSREGGPRSPSRLVPAPGVCATWTAGGPWPRTRRAQSGGVAPEPAASPGSSLGRQVHLLQASWGVCSADHRPGLTQQKPFLSQSGGLESDTKVCVGWFLPRPLSLACRRPSSCGRPSVHVCVLICSYRDSCRVDKAISRASLCLPYFVEAPHPSTATGAGGEHLTGFGGTVQHRAGGQRVPTPQQGSGRLSCVRQTHSEAALQGWALGQMNIYLSCRWTVRHFRLVQETNNSQKLCGMCVCLNRKGNAC